MLLYRTYFKEVKEIENTWTKKREIKALQIIYFNIFPKTERTIKETLINVFSFITKRYFLSVLSYYYY